jgi:TPR repeat protein
MALAIAMSVPLSLPAAAETPFDAALAAYSDGDFSRARQLWEQALAANDWDSARSLGQLYHRGQGVAQNDAKAAEYYKLAFDHGVRNAGLNLAELYESGQGVPRDPVKAKELLNQAAAMGSPAAAFRLGEILAAEQAGNPAPVAAVAPPPAVSPVPMKPAPVPPWQRRRRSLRNRPLRFRPPPLPPPAAAER